MILICLSFFIVTQAYSSSLMSYLTVDIMPKRFKTLDEIASQSLEYHAYGNEFKTDLLAYANPTINNMASNVFQIIDTKTSLEAVLAGKVGFVDSHVAVETKIRQSLMDRQLHHSFFLACIINEGFISLDMGFPKHMLSLNASGTFQYLCSIPKEVSLCPNLTK